MLIFLAGIWLKFVNRIEIKGIEKIPACGKLIVACNHRSNADPPVVGVCLAKKRHARFIAKRELFEIPVLNWILRNIGCIPVDRHKAGGDLR
ncbi:MAG: lysophospholipid acyltransferase family protein, partial [Elusimicrobia bacterium]|nr:lysophospholipid acyltransferase family protein [Elusimicrobiota bacterium]